MLTPRGHTSGIKGGGLDRVNELNNYLI